MEVIGQRRDDHLNTSHVVIGFNMKKCFSLVNIFNLSKAISLIIKPILGMFVLT